MSPERNSIDSAPSRSRPWQIWAEGVAAGIVLLLLTLLLVDFERTPRAFPQTEGRVSVSGLLERASILRDARGIPRIRARSVLDGYVALGFAHAQDRLAQMIWLRACARGRSAELIGRAGLPSDREARLLGIGNLAEVEASGLDASTREILEAFARGVNARIERVRRAEVDPSIALQELDLDLEEVEPWTPADSLALVKLYAWGLDGSIETGLVYQALLERLGGFGAVPFLPDDSSDTELGLPRRARRAAVSPPSSTAVGASFHHLRAAVGLWGRGVGSSAWVVGAGLSASGAPLLAADLHMEPLVPALMMEAELRAEALELAGVMIPGIPVFWSGRNAQVAWAATGTSAVVADLFIETLHPRDPQRYRDRGRWRRISEREEVIRVRGGRTETMVIRETQRGPLIQPWYAVDHEPLSLAWTGAQPGNGIAALLRAVTAKDIEGFRAALSEHHEPPLVFALVDRAGGAAMQMAGWLPRRSNPTKLIPVPGQVALYRWGERIPAAELPAVRLKGDSSWLIAADRPLSDWSDGARIEWRQRGGERAARVAALLREAKERGPLSLDDLVQMQGDIHSAIALELRDASLALLDGEDGVAGVEESVALLAAWDGALSTRSEAASVYHLFVSHLFRELFTSSLGPELLDRYLALPEADPERVLLRVLRGAGRAGAERWGAPDVQAAAVQRSLEKAWVSLLARGGGQHYRWGELHGIHFRPLFGGASPTSLEEGFPAAGDGHTVSVAAFDGADPFGVRVVSAYRFAVDAADMRHALSVLLPGQSEHEGHPHLGDGIEPWLRGQPRPFTMGEGGADTDWRHHLVLLPAH